MTTIDDETRARVARGWEKSGLSQAEYAARSGISERTLRGWRLRFVPSGMPAEAVRRIVEEAVQRLQALLAALDEHPAAAPLAPSAGPAAVRVEANAAATPPSECELPASVGQAAARDQADGAAAPRTQREAPAVVASSAEERRPAPPTVATDATTKAAQGRRARLRYEDFS
jgi:transcriptional regulator with XRE-family HTH domain